MNYCDFLFNVPQKYLHNIALIDGDTRYSYIQLQNKVKRVAAWFLSNGFKKNDVIALHLYNSANAVIFNLAVQYSGLISCLLDPLVKPPNLPYYLNDSKTRLLITHLQSYSSVNTQCQVLNETELVEKSSQQLIDRSIPSSSVSFNSNDVSFIFYTSGTTSMPKGVMLMPKNYCNMVNIVNKFCYQYTPEDRLLCFVPFSHGFGSIFIFLPCLSSGACMIIMRSFQLQHVVNLIHDHNITYIYGVPSHYQQLIRIAGQSEKALGALKQLKSSFCAAAYLKPEISRKWYEITGYHLSEGYGLIETSTLVTFRNNRLPEKPGDVGNYFSDLINIEIVDLNDNILKPEEKGEIIIKGDSVMKGYLNRQKENELALKNGWFHTGDLGFKTIDNRIILTGRKKEMINTAGIKTSPFEIEIVLNSFDDILESAVVGVLDKVYGEISVAFVRMREEAIQSERKILIYAQKHLMNIQVPRKILFIKEFPLNSMGKIDKPKLTVYAQKALSS